MSSIPDLDCKLIRPSEGYGGKQGFSYIDGISAQSAGAEGIAMMLLTIPPGGRAKAHMHAAHETAIYVMAGEAVTYWGDRLQHRVVTRAGDMFYIPAGMPHLPINLGTEPCTAVIARTDPNEQESVVLLPELESLVRE
jgi:uncharacterized RmlC-like cupin family protein